MKLIVSALALLVFAQDEKLELRWKWEKGRELIYKTQQKTIMELGGAPMGQEISNTYSMTVTSVAENGDATVTMKYLALGAKGNGPTGEYDYDSEKDKEPPTTGPAAFQAKMLGQSFVMKMTPTGKVTDVQGFEKILEEMLKGQPADDGGATKMQLKQMFSNDAFKGMMQQMAPPLPDAKVGKSDTWNNEFTVKVPMLGSMNYVMKSTMSELQDKKATIDQDIAISLKPGADKDNPFAGMIEIKDAKGKAQSVFSASKGCFLSQKTTMEMLIGVGGQAMPMKTVSEMKLVEKVEKK
jgi:hypothetical protein